MCSGCASMGGWQRRAGWGSSVASWCHGPDSREPCPTGCRRRVPCRRSHRSRWCSSSCGGPLHAWPCWTRPPTPYVYNGWSLPPRGWRDSVGATWSVPGVSPIEWTCSWCYWCERHCWFERWLTHRWHHCLRIYGKHSHCSSSGLCRATGNTHHINATSRISSH